MRDTKSTLLLIVSFLLLVVSCVLLWTWGYRVYRSGNIDTRTESPVSKGLATPAGSPADTLQKNFTAVVNSLDNQLDATWTHADSLKARLDIKLAEFNKLRNEITELLKNPGNNADLGMARQKIGELQQVVDELRNRNRDVENENRRLNTVLAELSAYTKNPAPNMKRVSFEEKQPAETTNNAAVAFTASDLVLSAITLHADKEEETQQAQQTEKLVGSFLVKNNSNLSGNTEMIVVVLQPDGQVVKTSAWESGTFNTPEGKKIYSYKIRFDMLKGESRRLLFSLSTDKYQKGNYTMQVYYNGLMIGKMYKTLS
jgi:regulator of replication initiation timing